MNTIPETIKDIFLSRGTIDEGFTIINTFLAGFVLTLFLALFLYSPVWYFLNSGIVFSNKKKVDDFVDSIEIRSIRNWYRAILRGYAGIGLVITYLQFLVTTFNKFDDADLAEQIILLVFIIPFLIIVVFSGLPVILFLEYTKEIRFKYINKITEKFKSSNKVNLIMDKIDKK
ncbi:MAG: hypothetical protein JXA99_01805 [Candidatus Lokiarchaeota archaeon]|nr:hypothetical protein [Candidatus Lokiarchaeota archaeon]